MEVRKWPGNLSLRPAWLPIVAPRMRLAGPGVVVGRALYKFEDAKTLSVSPPFHWKSTSSIQFPAARIVRAEFGGALLRNTRKTECGAKVFLVCMLVRAAPFALLRQRIVCGRAA